MTTKNIMKLRGAPWGLAALVTALFAAGIQAQQVSTIITNGLLEPNYLTTDPSNNVYIADSSHNRIVKFNVVQTNTSILAGSSAGRIGTNNGAGLAAQFYQPMGIVYDAYRGGLVVVDSANQTLRFVTLAGVVTNLAGIPNNQGGGNVSGPLGSNQFSYPVGITTDHAGNLYVADAGNSEIRVLNSSNILSTIGISNVVLITNFLPNGVTLTNYVLEFPKAVAFDPATSNLWVADTSHQTICLITNININPSVSNTLFVVAGTPGVSGTNDSSAVSSAQFNQPEGLLWDTTGLGLFISDTGNHTIRQLTWSPANGYSVQTVAGSPGVSGFVDGVPSVARFFEPVGLAIDTAAGGYYVADRKNNAIRSLVVTPVIPPSTIPPDTQPVAAPTFSPNSGYYPNCVTIVVNAGVPNVYYSVNGAPPANGSKPNANSIQVAMTNSAAGGFEGSFQFCNGQENLSIIQMVAINGTNFSSIVTGLPPNENLIGVPFSKLVGAGSTAIIPVEANLKTGVVLQSFQFVVEISPNGSAPPIATPIQTLELTNNEFVTVNGPAVDNLPFDYQQTRSVPEGFPANTQGLIISTAEVTWPAPVIFRVTGNAVLALLKVKIPATATNSQSYTISVLNPSGTSDGFDTGVPLQAIPSQTLTVSNLQYFVGDTGPNSGYSSGEFGDGLLDNSDVNNAVWASVGMRVPDTDTDAYNAMQAFGETANAVPGFPAPELSIRMADWETILSRSLGVDTNNWIRYWTNTPSGAILSHTRVGWTNGVPTPIGVPHISPRDQVSTPLGQVWVPNATFSAGSLSGFAPGSVASIPVSVTVQPGSALAGMQFRAILSANGGAPAPGQINFTPAAGIPNPSRMNGLSPNDTICIWPLPLLAPGSLALQGSNLIGSISFTVPAAATSGQSYSLHFFGSDGMPDLNTRYQLESVPGVAGVGSAALTPQITSDEWRMSFFGSTTSPQAQDNADPDGDGVPNWLEYLAGTNPTNALSALQFSLTSPGSGASRSIRLGWLTAPGKNYVLESSPTAGGPNWTAVNTNVGDGNQCQISVTNLPGSARFYRIRLQQ